MVMEDGVSTEALLGPDRVNPRSTSAWPVVVGVVAGLSDVQPACSARIPGLCPSVTPMCRVSIVCVCPIV